MTALEGRVRALAAFSEPPLFAAIPGFPVALLAFVRERWTDVRALLGVWSEGEALLICHMPVWDIVQAVSQADLVRFVETHLSFAKTTLAIVRRPLGPGEVLCLVTDGAQVSAPRLRFFDGAAAPEGSGS